MLMIKNAVIAVSLSAAILAPTAASACNCAPVRHETKTEHKQVSEEHTKKVESSHKDVDKTVVTKEDEKPAVKPEEKPVEVHVAAKSDEKNETKHKVCPPKQTPAPKPVVTPTPGKGAVQSTVTVAPAPVVPAAVKTAATLPQTGAGPDAALGLAAASSIGVFTLMKRRNRA